MVSDCTYYRVPLVIVNDITDMNTVRTLLLSVGENRSCLRLVLILMLSVSCLLVNTDPVTGGS